MSVKGLVRNTCKQHYAKELTIDVDYGRALHLLFSFENGMNNNFLEPKKTEILYNI